MTNPTQMLERFVRPKTVLLTSYRRNGTPVGTPVSIAVNGEHAFVRTWDTTRSPCSACPPSERL